MSEWTTLDVREVITLEEYAIIRTQHAHANEIEFVGTTTICDPVIFHYHCVRCDERWAVRDTRD